MEKFQPRLILCPTEFSEMATSALKYGKMICAGFEARMLVLFADRFEPPPYFTAGQEKKLIKSLESSRKAASVNYSELSRKALGHAAAMAERFGAELTVIHAIESPSDLHSDAGEMDRLCAWVPRDIWPTCNFKEVIRRGDAAEQILDLAASTATDLIVLGSQHKPFSDSTVIGTTTVNVTRHSPCPVLTVMSK